MEVSFPSLSSSGSAMCTVSFTGGEAVTFLHCDCAMPCSPRCS